LGRHETVTGPLQLRKGGVLGRVLRNNEMAENCG
jgi:hypothetical protein